MKTIALKNGDMPLIGIGTYQMSNEEAYEAIKYALEIGYRHVDTADRYHNHEGVGRAIEESGVARDEIFLTTKVWSSDLKPQNVIDSTKRFLKELNTNYLDLLLVHWPNKNIPIEKTLSAMEELKSSGAIKSYGVSNFTIHHLEDALSAGYYPEVNQVEFHPSLNQDELNKYCKENKIILTAYSPLAQGADLNIKEVELIANKYSVPKCNVILAWLLQKGIVVIPKSTRKDHIEDNLTSQNLVLDQDDTNILDSLDKGNRIINHSSSEFDY